MAKRSDHEAIDWLHAVLFEDDFREAWVQTHEDLRLDLAQQWLWERRDQWFFTKFDVEGWAHTLAEPGMPSPARKAFEEDTQRDLRRRFATYERQSWRAKPGVPVSPDDEVVVISAAGEHATIHLRMRLSRRGRWAVVGVGENAARPRWPR